jgi:hypothetical protein
MHPCPPIVPRAPHPDEYADTFGGIADPQDAIAAIESDEPAKKELLETVARVIFAPVVDVHWVTVKQLAQLEPTLVEIVACMIGALLAEALEETVNTMGVPREAARGILLGHTQVVLANTLKGSNPFSDACLTPWNTGVRRSSATTGRKSSRMRSSTRISQGCSTSITLTASRS